MSRFDKIAEAIKEIAILVVISVSISALTILILKLILR